MLVKKAVGDAYGLGFEFKPKTAFALNDLTSYLPHGLYPIKPGNYSDDTQRATRPFCLRRDGFYCISSVPWHPLRPVSNAGAGTHVYTRQAAQSYI